MTLDNVLVHPWIVSRVDEPQRPKDCTAIAPSQAEAD